MSSQAIMSTFRELAPAKIAEIKSELQSLEKSSEEVQRYKLLLEDLKDWQKALGVEPAPAVSHSSGKSPWAADLMPQILQERGEPMTRTQLKAEAQARGVRAPGSDPEGDLDRFLSHARNYGDLVERNGKIMLPSQAIVEVLKENGKPMTPDALTDAILPEHTKAAKIRKRYEENFKGKVLQRAINDGVVVMERGRVTLKS